MFIGNKHWLVLLLVFFEACNLPSDTVEDRINELKSSDKGTRQKAAEELGKLGDARAVQPLIACLGDPDWEVHKREFSASLLKGIGAKAEEEFGKHGDARAVPPPAALDWEVRKSAINALVQIGKPAIRPLLICLTEQQSLVMSRGSVAGIFANPAARDAGEALSKMGKAAVEPLIANLKDRDPGLRRVAATMLGNIGDVRAVQALVTSLKDRDSQVAGSAEWALIHLGKPAIEPLLDCLKDKNPQVRKFAAHALGRLGDIRAIGPLVTLIRDTDSNMRDTALLSLVHLGAPAVEPLIACLKDQDWHVRCGAVSALGRIRDIRAVEPLIACLKDENSDVRWHAADALGKLGDMRAVEPLTACLKDEVGYFCVVAREALRKLNNPDARR